MNIKTLCALTLLAPIGLAVALGGIHVEPDEENVIQDRLAGVWVVDSELRARMGVSVDKVELEFVVDPSFLADLPEKYDEFLGVKPVYEAGRMVRRRNGRPQSFPYLLTTLHGNPHLVWFRERDGDPFGDAESCNLSLVPGKDRVQDLLFMGGDFDGVAFRAFHRKPEEADQ